MLKDPPLANPSKVTPISEAISIASVVGADTETTVGFCAATVFLKI
jgi:hypothetical protein